MFEEHHEFLEEDITDSEWVMQNATGRKGNLSLDLERPMERTRRCL